LAGYEDVNDAERLCRDPAMRWVVGDRAITGCAASASQMGRFETKWLCRPENLAALTDLPGEWIDKVHQRRPPKTIVLDMDSSESPTYGQQEGTSYNGHFGCTCYHPLFVFNQLGDMERCALRSGNVHSADGWPCSSPSIGIVTESGSGEGSVSGMMSRWLRSATTVIASRPRSSSTRSSSISASP
jgi:Transposase DDE domain group 1